MRVLFTCLVCGILICWKHTCSWQCISARDLRHLHLAFNGCFSHACHTHAAPQMRCLQRFFGKLCCGCGFYYSLLKVNAIARDQSAFYPQQQADSIKDLSNIPTRHSKAHHSIPHMNVQKYIFSDNVSKAKSIVQRRARRIYFFIYLMLVYNSPSMIIFGISHRT